MISPSDSAFLADKLHCYAVARVFCMVARWQISDTRYLSGPSVCVLFFFVVTITNEPSSSWQVAPPPNSRYWWSQKLTCHSKRQRVLDSSGSQTCQWLTSSDWTLQTVLVLRRRRASPLKGNISFGFPVQILTIKDYKKDHVCFNI